MPSKPTMLLVHSPLLTTATWNAIRPHLEAAGWRVTIPDLRPLIDAQSFHAAVCAMAASSVQSPPTVVMGHSRAGAYLPGIAEAVGGEGRLDVVFLDARLPYPGASWIGSLPPHRAAWMRELAAASGRLPAWDSWFPPGSLDELVPDPVLRGEVLGDLPELPWQLVSEVLPVPGKAWDSARHIYLQLSAAYQATAEAAGDLGYLVRSLDADHLTMVTRPAAVADLLLSAVRA